VPLTLKSPDGSREMSLAQEEGVDGLLFRLRTLPGGRELLRLPVRGVVDVLGFTPHGRRLVLGLNSDVIIGWGAAKGPEQWIWEGRRPAGAVIAGLRLAASPDGRLLVASFGGRPPAVFDLTAGREVRQLEGQAGVCKCVAFGPDGRLVAAGGEDK